MAGEEEKIKESIKKQVCEAGELCVLKKGRRMNHIKHVNVCNV